MDPPTQLESIHRSDRILLPAIRGDLSRIPGKDHKDAIARETPLRLLQVWHPHGGGQCLIVAAPVASQKTFNATLRKAFRGKGSRIAPLIRWV
jgi:hypothetical protein